MENPADGSLNIPGAVGGGLNRAWGSAGVGTDVCSTGKVQAAVIEKHTASTVSLIPAAKSQFIPD